MTSVLLFRPWLLPQWCALALASLLLMAPAAHAQSSARLAGSVFDATGLPLASVHVRLRGSSDMVTQTDANGRFELENLSEGEYELTAALQGYS
jgi:hypothetical protein